MRAGHFSTGPCDCCRTLLDSAPNEWLMMRPRAATVLYVAFIDAPCWTAVTVVTARIAWWDVQVPNGSRTQKTRTRLIAKMLGMIRSPRSFCNRLGSVFGEPAKRLFSYLFAAEPTARAGLRRATVFRVGRNFRKLSIARQTCLWVCVR